MESLRAKVIVQTDHSSILNIMQQSSITTTLSKVQMNICLVRASQFLCRFRLTVRHKARKKHIVSDALGRLASTNSNLPDHDPEYAKLDVFFAYSATLVELKPTMLSKIIRSYRRDAWWRKIFSHVEKNESLGINKAVLPFEKGKPATTSSGPYFQPKPEPS